MPPTTTWLFLCLMADLVIGFLLGWAAHATWHPSSSTTNEPPSTDGNHLELQAIGAESTDSDREDSNGHACCRVIDAITHEVGRHADTLNDLSESFNSPGGEDSADSSKESLSDTIRRTRDANRELEAVLEASTDRLSELAVDRDGMRPLFAQLCSYRDGTRELSELIDGSESDQDAAMLRTLLAAPVQALMDANHKLGIELLAARRTIVQQDMRLKEAEFDARNDPLTKLPNRRAFEEKVQALQTQYEQSGRRFGVVILDVDHFKALNDTYGHIAGDATLAVIGRVLSNHARTYDHVSRYGGEEFVVLLPDTTLDQAGMAAERFRKQIERTVVRCGDRQLRVTISGGVAEGCDPADLMSRADAALYAAKSAGRNQVLVHDGEQARAISGENLVPAETV